MDDGYVIPQFDGGNDSFDDENLVSQFDVLRKDIYAINSEIDEITSLVNFFRGCDYLWKNETIHQMCRQESVNEVCAFCYMRSSCLRLNLHRSKGPKSVKLVEFISLLPKFEADLGWNWRDNLEQMDKFIENTLTMLDNTEKIINNSSLKCQKCGGQFKCDGYIWNIRSVSDCLNVYKAADVLKELIQIHGQSECCATSLKTILRKEKILILKLSSPITMTLSATEELFGCKMKYISHIEEINGHYQTFFRHGDKMLYQEDETNIWQSKFGKHENVAFLFLSLDENLYDKSSQELKEFIFESQQPKYKYLSKKYLSIVNPEMFKEKYEAAKAYDHKRDKEPERKEMHRILDSKRDKELERKEMHRI